MAQGGSLPPPVAELLKGHRREAQKLRVNLRQLTKRLDLSTEEVVEKRVDVTSSQDQQNLVRKETREPYFLVQPKAKKKGALQAGDNVMVKTQDGWEKARLESKTVEYQNGSYMWTYQLLDSGDACSSFLSPGESWGVLRDGEELLDFEHLEPRIPGGSMARYRLQSACSGCNEKGVEASSEEAEFLESRLPFPCAHHQQITAISVIGVPSEAANVTLVKVPRPQQKIPSAPLSVSSSVGSTVTWEKLERYLAAVTTQFEVLCSVHADLCAELESRKMAGDEINSQELKEEVLEELLMEYTDRVTEQTTKAEQRIEVMRLECLEVFQEVGENRLGRGNLLSRGSQGGFEEAGFSRDLELLNLSGNSGQTVSKQLVEGRERGEEALEAARQEAVRQEAASRDAARQEAASREVAGQEAVRLEAARQETARLEGVRQEAARQEVLSNLATRGNGTPASLPPLHISRSAAPAGGELARQQEVEAPGQQQEAYQVSPEEAVLAAQVQAARKRILEDLGELAEELKDCQARPGRQAVASLGDLAASIDREIGALDKLLAQKAIATPADRRGRALQEGEEMRLSLGQELRVSKRKIRGMSSSDSHTSGQPGDRPRSYIEKIKLPTFSGKLEAWPDFLKTWSDITAPEKMTNAVELLCLRQHVPKEAVELLDGVQDMETAWSRLKRKYGDKDLMILHVTRRLSGVSLTGPHYEQVEKLAMECERAVTLLNHFQAETLLQNDFELVARLSSKLPANLLLGWDVSCTERGGEAPSSWPHFLTWLRTQREVAHFARLRSLTKEAAGTSQSGGVESRSGAAGLVCFKCQAVGHSARECPHPPTQDLFSANAGRFQTEEEYKAERPEIVKRTGKCPFCGGEHTYQRQMSWGKVNFPSSCFDSCPKWRAAGVKDRAAAVEKAKGCPQCTSWNHPASRCWFRRKVECPASVGGQPCKKAHNLMLHNSENTYCVAGVLVAGVETQEDKKSRPGKKARQKARKRKLQASAQEQVINEEVHEGETVLLDTQSLTFRAEAGREAHTGETLWDSGSQGSLCTHKWAQSLNLRHEPTTYYLQVVGQGAAKKETRKYFADLQDRDGCWHRVHFLGIETLTSPGVPASLQAVQHLFPGVPDEVFRPRSVPVQVLIGKNFNSLMPSGGKAVGNLRMKESKFGRGFVLSGWSRLLSGPPQHLTSAAVLLASATSEPAGLPTPVTFMHLRTHTFLELEELGTSPEKYCKKCQNCSQCSYRGQAISRDQEAVVKAMEDSLERDPSSGQLSISYPFLPCTEQMKENSRQAIAVQTKVEQRLERDGLLEQYNDEMQQTIERGAVVPLGSEDLKYNGPIHYITHFGVLNPESKSTKLRIVSNSASKNQHSGLSLNDCMEDGPNTLNGLLQVLLGWRSLEAGLLYDLSKAYQAMRTRIKERNLRRLVWRPKPGMAWKHFGYDCANFGDKLAPLALELGKKRTAEEGEKIDSMAAEQLLNLTYVDDNCGGGTENDIKRMVGEVEEAGTISKILKTCNFKAKAFVTSGMQEATEAGALGEKVLGVGYYAGTDKLHLKLRPVMLTPGARIRTARIMSEKMIREVKEGRMKITKRMALSFVNGQYDPLGLLAPVSLKLKLLLKQLYRPERSYEWDEPLEETQQQLWVKSLEDAAKMEEVEFLRSVRPPHAKGEAWLVGFGDGSMDAYGAAIYTRWEVQAGKNDTRVEVRLVLGKSRVTPQAGTTPPRAEAQAAVVLSRLMLTVVKAVRFPVERIILASDSEAFIAATEKSTGTLGPYLTSRVSEFHLNLEDMRKKTFVEPLQHVPGTHNIADLATRGQATNQEIAPGSEWQDGPEYLKQPREQWPFSREFYRAVPPEELRRKSVTVGVAALKTGTDRLSKVVEEVMRHASTLDRAEAVLARVCRALFSTQGEEARREQARVEPGVLDLRAARRLMMLCSMGPSIKALQDGKLSSLGAEYTQGLVQMRGRLPENRLAILLGASSLPVLQPSTRLAYLIVRQGHEKTHRKGFRVAVAESRQVAWIPRAGNLAKNVVSQCMRCRKERMIPAAQKMADVPERMTVPSPCFTHVSCDLFGPYLCRGMGNTRVRMKVWGVVFVCEATRAISVLAVGGYSTEQFLNAYHRFTANRGDPTTVLSDHGSQLLSAAKRVDPTITRDIDWEKVASSSARSGTTWTFSPVGCPWRNPLAERMVGLVKETLLHQLKGNESLDYAQLDTLFAVVARIVNDRPLGVQLLDEMDFLPVTCNDLILRRSPGEAMGRRQEESIMERLYAQEHLIRAWWEEWYLRVFPSLVPYQKWKVSRRNVQEGDVVLIIYPGKISKGDYRLARVIAAAKDENDHVRTVTVALRPRNLAEKSLPYKIKQLTRMTLAVQRLVVILPVEEQEKQRRGQAEEEERMRVAGLPPIKEMILQRHKKEAALPAEEDKISLEEAGGEEAGEDEDSHPLEDGSLKLEEGGEPHYLEEGDQKRPAAESKRSSALGREEEDALPEEQGVGLGFFSNRGLRVSRRLRGLLPQGDLFGHVLVGYVSEDE